jgi:hypothetical protein
VKHTETREGKARSQSRRTTSAKAAFQLPEAGRQQLACSCCLAVSSNASNIHARPRVDLSTKEPHRQDKSRSPPSLLFTFLARASTVTTALSARRLTSRNTALQLVAAPSAGVRLRHFTTYRYARLLLSRAIFATSSPSHPTALKSPDRVHPPSNWHH